MLMKLILLFTLTPIIELFILFQLAGIMGTWSTIGLVFITGIAGAYLAKSEGRLIISKIKRELNQGKLPGNELINGLCVLVGGALLLTPGLITDIVGFSLVIPGLREIYKLYIKRKFRRIIDRQDIHIDYRWED